MSEGLETPWLHETNLIISDKDRQGQAWRLYVEEVLTNHVGVTTGRFSSKEANLSVDPRAGEAHRLPGTEV